jgi:hypothetical protein
VLPGQRGSKFRPPKLARWGETFLDRWCRLKTGYIVKWTGSFDLAFYLAFFLLFLAALVCFTMTRQPLNFEESVA